MARALGYDRPHNAIERHCKDGGMIHTVLIVNSKLPSAEKFERWVFDEALPTICKHGSYTAPDMSSTDLLELQARALREIEDRQAKQEQALDDTNKRIDNLGNVIALNTQAWREQTRNLIYKVAQAIGGEEGFIAKVQNTIYNLVDERASVSLETRLANKRCRMAQEGAS